MQIPLIENPEVWHIGTLCSEDSNPSSYEGHLLSVSVHPSSWGKIASLSGPLWRLTCPISFFVDAHALMEDEALRDSFLSWGEAQGLIEHKEAWEASYFDDDLERELTFTFDSLEGLLREFEEEGVEIGEKKSLAVMTKAALQRYDLNKSATGTEFSLDYVLIDWIEQCFLPQDPRIMGVWWEDEFNPAGLSAPRGGIFPSRLDLFSVCLEERSALDVELDTAPSLGETGPSL